jgi:hypothetical protein
VAFTTRQAAKAVIPFFDEGSAWKLRKSVYCSCTNDRRVKICPDEEGAQNLIYVFIKLITGLYLDTPSIVVVLDI